MILNDLERPEHHLTLYNFSGGRCVEVNKDRVILTISSKKIVPCRIQQCTNRA